MNRLQPYSSRSYVGKAPSRLVPTGNPKRELVLSAPFTHRHNSSFDPNGGLREWHTQLVSATSAT